MRNSRSRIQRRGIAVVACGLTLVLGLSGCSASYWPDLSPEVDETATTETAEPNGTLATVPVSQQQIQAIIDGVSEAAKAGDEELDASLLEDRFAGDALAQRAANYKVRQEVDDYGSTPAHITNKLLNYQLIQSTEGWPRTLFVTVESEAVEDEDGNVGDAPSLALVLQQRIPQENFRVTRVISLRGGIDMPQAAPADEGTAVLSDDLESLVLPPGEVGTAYAAILQQGAEAEEAEFFDLESDPLVENYGIALTQQTREASDAEDMEFSVTVEQGPERVVSLSTGVGGALVLTTVVESQIVASKDDGRYKPQAQGAVSALSGLSGQQDRIVREVAHQILFFVPSKADGSKIQLLGVTSELVGAGN